MECARCKRPLRPGEERRIPRLIALLASFALALGHAGLWAQSGLAKPFCPRCRRLVLAAALALTLGAALVAAAGAWVWLRAAAVARKLQP